MKLLKIILFFLLLICNILFSQSDSLFYNYKTLNQNNIEIYINNYGGLDVNLYGYGARWNILHNYDVIVYDQGPWVVGKINNEKKASISMWNRKFIPGPVINGSAAIKSNPEDSLKYRVYRIAKNDSISNPDYNEWPGDLGAPVDKYGYPLVYADQTTWNVFNGLGNPYSIMNWDGGNIPVEIRQLAYVHRGNETDNNNLLANVVFFEWEIINKGQSLIDSAFFGLWTDIDFSSFFDNLPGIDITNQLGYCWSNLETMVGTSEPPPAIGYVLLFGPEVPSQNSTAIVKGKKKINFKNLPITSFHPIIDDAIPLTAPLYAPPFSVSQIWNAANGLDIVGDTVYNPETGNPTSFIYDGDPVTNTGWIYNGNSGGGAGFVFFAGPFTMAPADTQWVMAALIPAQGKTNLESLKILRQKADILRNTPYDSLAFGNSILTNIAKGENSKIPLTFNLFQNYPNPFNPSTIINYDIPVVGTSRDLFVQLKIYDTLGREVATLVNKSQKPGNYKVEFDASQHPSGVYFYRLIADNYTKTKKMILIR